SYGLLQHLVRRDAQSQAQGAVAIVRIEPIVAGSHRHRGSDLHGFVTRTADLKINAALAFERDLAVIQAPGRVYQAEGANQLLRSQPFEARRDIRLLGSDRRSLPCPLKLQCNRGLAGSRPPQGSRTPYRSRSS